MKKNNYIIIILIIISSLYGILTYFCFKNINRSIQVINFYNSEINNTKVDLLFNGAKDINLDNNSEYFSGKGVTVAILDTGIFPNHSVFTDNQKKDWNERIIAFYDNEIDGLSPNPYDISWHGTWTASILGGNSTQYRGVAPGIKFVIIKIFELENGGLTTNIEQIENAINWLINNKAKYNVRIASMSFGAKYEENDEATKELNEIVEKLMKENILVVAASGNYGDTTDQISGGTVSSPGSAKMVLTVGGVDYNGNMYIKSGEGPTFEGVDKPDVCAPAISILGASSDSINNYSSYTGTSASTPYVSGLAAVLLEKNPELSANELKSIISMTAYRTYKPEFYRDNIQGWGIVQGYAALDALDNIIKVSSDLNLKIYLSEKKGVFCRPIKLQNYQHYFFQLISLNNAYANLLLFDKEPDDYGNPVLLASSFQFLSINTKTKIVGLYTFSKSEFFLIIKLIHNTGSGEFSIRLIIDYRLILIGIFSILNTISLIYIIIFSKKIR
ncbi:MAG: S8 family serine peptidase [Promethearchaeota archaeon]